MLRTTGKCRTPKTPKGCGKFLGWAMLSLSVLFLFIDAADVIVDMAYVVKLSNEGKKDWAALLGCAVAFAVPVEIVFKVMLFRFSAKNKKDLLSENNHDERIAYLIFMALSELVVFLLEDATTIFVWYQTGTFDSSHTFSMVNLYLTVGSAILVRHTPATP